MPSNSLNASKDAKIKLSRPKSSGPNQRANKIADKKETPALKMLFKKLTKNLLRIEGGYVADIIYRL